VGIGCYRIDLHPRLNGAGYLDLGCWPFQIPLGAMVPVRRGTIRLQPVTHGRANRPGADPFAGRFVVFRGVSHRCLARLRSLPGGVVPAHRAAAIGRAAIRRPRSWHRRRALPAGARCPPDRW
jgi:hypothetical protein